MDLLFKRYASPFNLLDGFIMTNSLADFIDDFLKFIEEEYQEKTQWEFFLHRAYDESWSDFCKRLKPTENKKIDLGATLTKSHDMLKNFTPT